MVLVLFNYNNSSDNVLVNQTQISMTREEHITMTNMPDHFQSAAQTKTSSRQSGSVYSTVTLQPQRNSGETSLSIILIQRILIDLLVREFVLPL